MDKATVVLYSGLGGIGHLTPMVQLSQLFVQHGVAVTVALVAELGDSPLSLPGAPPFRAADLPKIVLDDDDATRVFVRLFERMPESNGILVNTYESHALRDGGVRPRPPDTTGLLCWAAGHGGR